MMPGMDKYALIRGAMQQTAHAHRKPPTAAQSIAGNYQKGRLNLHGLKIAIENPLHSFREGKAPDGTRWRNMIMADYGDITGTVGADGDPVDVFVGPWPESEQAWVINQIDPATGSFDEHKVMLGFTSDEAARSAYLGSYQRGWGGLESMIPVTFDQLKWWLKNGDMKKPISLQSLPYDGTSDMNQIAFDSAANPIGTDYAALLYDLRREDADGLLLDAVTPADIVEDSEGELTLDALVVPVAKLERKMTQLQAIMGMAGDQVKPVAMQVTAPFKNRGTTNVAAVYELSDGQTVSVFFHNPDTTPNKLAPADELVSWKWLLNKKDITLLVAPERGQDLNPREVARRIMRLAERNSARFQQANKNRAERLAAIAGLKEQVSAKEAQSAALDAEIEALTVKVEEKRRTQAPAPGQPVGEQPHTGTENAPATVETANTGVTAVANEKPATIEGQGDTLANVFKNPNTGKPVVTSNKASADAIARSKQLNGNAVVRKATEAELKRGDLHRIGYDNGERLSLGYVIELPNAAISETPVVAQPVTIEAVADLMGRWNSDASLWSDAEAGRIIREAEKLGWVRRHSTSQVQWTQAGADATKGDENPSAAFKAALPDGWDVTGSDPQQYRARGPAAKGIMLDTRDYGRRNVILAYITDEKGSDALGAVNVQGLSIAEAMKKAVGVAVDEAVKQSGAGDFSKVNQAFLSALIDLGWENQSDSKGPLFWVTRTVRADKDSVDDATKKLRSIMGVTGDQRYSAKLDEAGGGYVMQAIRGDAPQLSVQYKKEMTPAENAKAFDAEFSAKIAGASSPSNGGAPYDANDPAAMKAYRQKVQDTFDSGEIEKAWTMYQADPIKEGYPGGTLRNDTPAENLTDFVDDLWNMGTQAEFWKMPVATIKGWSPEVFEAVSDALENWNFHPENLLLNVKRFGSAADLKEAEAILKGQRSQGGLSGEIYERRKALWERLAIARDIAENGDGLDFEASRVAKFGAAELARRAAWFEKYGHEKYANNPAFIALREALQKEFGTDNIADFAGARVRGVDPVEASIAYAKSKRDSQQVENDSDQSAFAKFDPAKIKMPTAVQLGIKKLDQFKTFTLNGVKGWTNTHMLDLAGTPKVISSAIKDVFGDDSRIGMNANAVDIVVSRAKGSSTTEVEPVALYDGTEISARAKAENVDPAFAPLARKAVILVSDDGALSVSVGLHYFSYFFKQYKGAKFYASDENGPVVVKRGGEVVGVVMPLRGHGSKALKRALRAAGRDEQAVAAVEASQPQPFSHAGFSIYPWNGRWAVQSIENREREQRGERQAGGDTIVDTPEAAKAEAERQAKRAEDDAQFAAELAANEKTEADRAQAVVDRFAGFVEAAGLSAMAAEKARQHLTQMVSSGGKAVSMADLIERMVAEGRTIGEYNGKRTLEKGDGAFIEEKKIGKTGMDYAEFLIAKRAADAAKPGGVDATKQFVRAADVAFLRSVIDGKADMMDPDLADRLVGVAEQYEGDADMSDLVNRAAEAYSNAIAEQARAALA